MLIAISGSQGSGKSTILDELERRGLNTIKRKSSRSILSDWDVSLREVNNDPALTIRFQDEITKRKYEDESEAAMSNELWFTERTHADLFTYALASIGKDNTHSDWLSEYYDTCLRYNQSYDGVFYLKGGMFPVEHDGTRGSNHHYSRMIDLTMSDVTSRMIHSSKLQMIDVADLHSRVNAIVQLSLTITRK